MCYFGQASCLPSCQIWTEQCAAFVRDMESVHCAVDPEWYEVGGAACWGSSGDNTRVSEGEW
jgi:hypothetical protein